MDGTHQLQAGSNVQPIAPVSVNYIKLGRSGQFAGDCFAGGYIGLGFDAIPHDLCRGGDWQGVRACFLAAGKKPAKAADHTREVRTFYEADADVLWITLAQDRLWWAFAEPLVSWEPTAAGRLPRRRKTIGPWRSADVNGAPLLARALSTRLTSISRYQGTLCAVREQRYLLDRINGQEEPLIAEAEALRTALHDLTQRLILTLHHRDFEIMVDLIFQASGWRRVSVLGETEADADLLLEQIATGERAFVQVKSRATPAVLEDYIARFKARGDCGRMFFICHSPSPALAKQANGYAAIDLWLGDSLAAKALRAGLFDWIVDRVR